MFQDWRNDIELQQAIRALFLGIAPERSNELDTLWNNLQLEFRLFSDGDQVMMEGGAFRYVHFNHRILRIVWVSAFAAWEGYVCLHTAQTKGTPQNSDRLKELLQVALDVRDAKDPESISLAGLPEPGHLPDKNTDPQLRAAAELAMFAVGWALLHEVQHLTYQQEGTSAGPDAIPELARKEELSCDEFATQFLIRDVVHYGAESGFDPETVQMKRSVGIYFAIFSLVVLSHPNWEETGSHPSIQHRLDAVRNKLNDSDTNKAFCIAMLAFSALQNLWPSAPNLTRC